MNVQMEESELRPERNGPVIANPEEGKQRLRDSAPAISNFYADKARPREFSKAVRQAKIRSFDAEDTSEALRKLDQTDPILARTLSLMGKGPEAIDRWTVTVAKALLSAQLQDSRPDELGSARVILDYLLRKGAADLGARNKVLRTRTQNLLRLVLAWLLQERNLNPTEALMSIAAAMQKGDGRSAGSHIYWATQNWLSSATSLQLPFYSRTRSLPRSGNVRGLFQKSHR
jgi:hypothetical protein